MLSGGPLQFGVRFDNLASSIATMDSKAQNAAGGGPARLALAVDHTPSMIATYWDTAVPITQRQSTNLKRVALHHVHT